MVCSTLTLGITTPDLFISLKEQPGFLIGARFLSVITLAGNLATA